jgi:hypothetical protein
VEGLTIGGIGATGAIGGAGRDGASGGIDRARVGGSSMSSMSVVSSGGAGFG